MVKFYIQMTHYLRGVGRGRALRASAPPLPLQKQHTGAPPSLVCATLSLGYWYRLVADHQHAQELASNLRLQCSS